MKFFRALRFAVALFVVSLSPAFAEKVATMPAPTGYVDDYAGVMTTAGKAEIDAICHEVHAKTKAQIFFVTIKSLEGESVDTFANDLFHKWKIGEKKTDRGILVLLAIDDHKRRIEVGYVLEGILTDAEAGFIGREMVPALKNSDYDEAARVSVKAIASVIADDAKVSLTSTAAVETPALQDQPPPAVTSAPSSSEINGGGQVAMVILFVCFFGVFGLIIWGVIRRNRGGYYAGPGYYDPGPSNTFTSFGGTNSGSNFSGSDSSSSSSSSDSSSSDSFSGGDGGDSGGGGASGDW